jgi:hypothetical protein
MTSVEIALGPNADRQARAGVALSADVAKRRHRLYPVSMRSETLFALLVLAPAAELQLPT